jgi:hypothetical protein
MSDLKIKFDNQTLVPPALKIYLPESLEEQAVPAAQAGNTKVRLNPEHEKEKIVMRLIEHLTKDL